MGNMAHLDIKAENCLVDGNGNLKLCDFGNSITFKVGQFFKGKRGTRGYACPEMGNGEAFCPKQADMWSLGVTLHVILTGCFPFSDDFEVGPDVNMVSLFNSNRHLSPIAANLLCHLLCVDPDMRFTIDQALAHPFFDSHKSKPNTFQLMKHKLTRIVNR